MIVLPLHKNFVKYLRERQLLKKYDKQVALLQSNILHPSLNYELLEPARMKLYSFRIDKKYRAIFNYIAPDVIEILDVNNHYR